MYSWWREGSRIWLFTLFDEDEMDDLTPERRGLLRRLIQRELEARRG